MSVKGRPRSAAEKERISKGTKWGIHAAREKRRMRQPVLDAYSRDGLVSEPMRPLLTRAQAELAGWIQARGGVDAVSELERSVLDDAATLGVVRDALLQLFLQNRDPEIATRISTLTGARRASLQAVGLERKASDVVSLDQYVRAFDAAESTAQTPQAEPCRTNGSETAPQVVDVDLTGVEKLGDDES